MGTWTLQTLRTDRIKYLFASQHAFPTILILAMLEHDDNKRNLDGTSHTDEAMTLQEARSKEYVSKNKAAIKIKHSN